MAPMTGPAMPPPIPLEALDDAIARVQRLLESPEWLLDPATEEAKGAAEAARGMVKLFFDAAQARAPAPVRQAAKGLESMVVDGFSHEQIWEELEVQNVPLRRFLRRRLERLKAAPKGTIDLRILEDGESAEAPASASGSKPGKKGKLKALSAVERELEEKIRALQAEDGDGKDGEDDEEAEGKKSKKGKKAKGKKGKKDEEDEEGVDGEEKDFFDADEMERFTRLADEGKLRLNDDSDGSEVGLMEASGDEELSGEERELDEMLNDMTGEKGEDNEGEEESGGEPDEEVDDAEDEVAAKFEQGKNAAMSKADRKLKKQKEIQAKEAAEGAQKARSLYEMDKRLKSLEEEVERLEEEQLKEKPWMMKGEVTAKQRPLNSLLEVHLDQPMTHLAGRRAEDAALAAGLGGEGQEDDALEDVPGADGAVKKLHFDVDAIIRQRIWDETYDDVVRKTELPPSQRPQKAEQDAVETLNFEKSRVGLGDIYAQQYEAEMLGHKTEGEVKDDAAKAETKALFVKLMHKLDLLSNMHFTPRPPMIGGPELGKVASLKMEETIPLMVSDAALKAPEELRAPRRHEREQAELTHDERVAVRRAKKEKRKKVLERKAVAGQVTLAGLREREEKLRAKNAEVKKQKAAKGEIKDPRKRLRASELLTQASQNASLDLSRKDEIRKERAARPAGTPSAKKLKL